MPDEPNMTQPYRETACEITHVEHEKWIGIHQSNHVEQKVVLVHQIVFWFFLILQINLVTESQALIMRKTMGWMQQIECTYQ